MGVWGEIAPSKAKKMQFSNSIPAIWCIPSANNLLKIQHSFKMKIFAIVMSIPPTFPLLFYDKILAISRLFLPPFLFWYLCQSYNKSLANEEKQKKGVSEEAEKNCNFQTQFSEFGAYLCQHFTENPLFISNKKLSIFMSIPTTFPVLMPLPELL